MFSRSLLARSGLLRPSVTLTTRAYSRSLSILRSAQPVPCAAPFCSSSRRFSAAPALGAETRDTPRTSRTPSGTCYVANLPYRVTAEQLKDAFAEFGKVEAVKMLTSDSGMSRGVGFVQFESVADAVSFVEAHQEDPIFVLDRRIYVEHANKTRNSSQLADPCDTLMVSDFRGQSEDEVRVMFGDFADSIMAVRFDRREVDRPSRRAFVQFHNVDIATEAMDVFQNQSGNPQISYARQRQTPVNSYSLTSRLSKHRVQ